MTCCSVCGTLTGNTSGLCDFCLDDLAQALDDDFDDGPWDTSRLTDEDLDPIALRPGEPPRPITTVHLPEDRDD